MAASHATCEMKAFQVAPIKNDEELILLMPV
jgi:hypothetical protein